MKQFIGSVLLLIIATLVFSQAETNQDVQTTSNEVVVPQQIQTDKSLANLFK